MEPRFSDGRDTTQLGYRHSNLSSKDGFGRSLNTRDLCSLPEASVEILFFGYVLVGKQLVTKNCEIIRIGLIIERLDLLD